MNPEELEKLYKKAVDGHRPSIETILDYYLDKRKRLNSENYSLNNIRSKLFVFDYAGDKKSIDINSILPMLLPSLHNKSSNWLPFHVAWIMQMQTHVLASAFGPWGLESAPHTPSNVLFFNVDDDPKDFKVHLEQFLLSEQYVFVINNIKSLELTEPLLKRKRPVIISTNSDLIDQAEKRGLSVMRNEGGIPSLWDAISNAENIHLGTLVTYQQRELEYGLCLKKRFLKRPVFKRDLYNGMLLAFLRGDVLTLPSDGMISEDVGALIKRIVSEYFLDSLLEELAEGLEEFHFSRLSKNIQVEVKSFFENENNYSSTQKNNEYENLLIKTFPEIGITDFPIEITLMDIGREIGSKSLVNAISPVLINLIGENLKKKISPSILIGYELDSWRKEAVELQKMSCDDSDIDGLLKFEASMKKLCLNVLTYLPKEIVDIFDAYKNSMALKVTIIGDRPIELHVYQGVSVNKAFPVTRLPLLPKDTAIKYLENTRHFYKGAISRSVPPCICVAGVAGDEVHKIGVHLKWLMSEEKLSFDLTFVESADQFRKLLRDNTSDVFIYIGHAGYYAESGKSVLSFPDESYFDSKEFEDLDGKLPPLMIFVGCETSACSAFNENFALMALANGALSVIGTMFPIAADAGDYFISYLLYVLYEKQDGFKNRSLSEVVQRVRLQSLCREMYYPLLRNQMIEPSDLVETMKKYSSRAGVGRLKGNFDWASNARQFFLDSLPSADVRDRWLQLEGSGMINYYSMYFVLYGFAHDIY